MVMWNAPASHQVQVPGGIAATGTPSSTTFLRGDGTWATPSAGSLADGDYGDITVSSSGAVWTIDNGVVTLAKIANAAANSKLLGSGAAGSGSPYAEITLGTNLSMSGTTLNAASGGGTSATTVEVDLGTPKCCGRFTITDAAIAATSKVLCWQAPGPYTGKGARADEAEMQAVLVTAVNPATGSAVVYWQTPPMIAMKPELNQSPRINAVGATFDRLVNQRMPTQAIPTRIGKVRGNVKFSYVIFS